MKVSVEIVDENVDEEATFKIHKITDEIDSCIKLLSDYNKIVGIKDNEHFIVDEKKIYYIESVDNKQFIYIKDDSFETKLKLYELENTLNHNFFRCSKSMILNSKKIKSVKAQINGRFIATLLNDEEVVIARSYVKDLKKILGL